MVDYKLHIVGYVLVICVIKKRLNQKFVREILSHQKNTLIYKKNFLKILLYTKNIFLKILSHQKTNKK